MILVGRYMSPFVRRVGITLKTLGLPFEHRSLSTLQDAEVIRQFNPMGKVPIARPSLMRCWKWFQHKPCCQRKGLPEDRFCSFADG